MKSAFLFGPFIGSLSWELYRFSPYAIFIKKKYPDYKLIVLTREDRFDLYGQYADILIPLRLNHDSLEKQLFFKLKNFSIHEYHKISKQFRHSYSKRFNLKGHFFPDISDYRYKLHWQFPRMNMLYNFCPRRKNREIIKNTFRKTPLIIFPPYNTDLMHKISTCAKKNKIEKKYIFITYDDFGNDFYNINRLQIHKGTSILGYTIELIKKSRLVIGPKSYLTHLSVLMNKPLVTWGDFPNLDIDNPKNSKIILYNKPPLDDIEKQLTRELGKRINESDYNCI